MPSSNNFVTREATLGDAAAIAALLAELGYRSSPGEITKRLGTLQAIGDRVIVAERHGEVIGLVTIHRISFLHRLADGRLTTVVVRQQSRGMGVGRRLVEVAEAVVRNWGGARIEVTSGTRRTEAQQFYQHLGYEHSANRFTKDVK